MARFRPRFTISTLLLVMVATCLVLSTWCTWYSLRGARKELEQANRQIHDYREAFGEFDVTDPKQIHARKSRRRAGKMIFSGVGASSCPRGAGACFVFGWATFRHPAFHKAPGPARSCLWGTVSR